MEAGDHSAIFRCGFWIELRARIPETYRSGHGAPGAAWSDDEGETWASLPDVAGFWAVAFASRKAGWLVGTEGRILKISFQGGGRR